MEAAKQSADAFAQLKWQLYVELFHVVYGERLQRLSAFHALGIEEGLRDRLVVRYRDMLVMRGLSEDEDWAIQEQLGKDELAMVTAAEVRAREY